MKKILIVLIVILICSCSQDDFSEFHKCEDLSNNYKGGIIYSKHSFWSDDGCGDVYFDIKYNGKILPYIKAYQINHKYAVGDTIK